ncbi:SLP adapter and CSK-interacting membrane protein [Mixophyes fleayi]|uniref:SLP adapter and CSK-interacting membrane protein n=1 Tax=Mixophyes fleayi TaxID=3061075 RepID=UPI003F4DE0C8
MDQPWYRQYFWLLVFGGIVIFAGIISLVMVCICRTQFSRRLTVRIQKSLKVKARHKQAQNSEVITNSYRSTVPPTTIIPDAGHHLYDTIPGNSTPDLCRIMYATAQKRPPPSQQLGLNSIPENSASGPCHITYATANKKPAPFQQFGLNSIPENSTQDLRRVMYATAQKRPAPSQQLGLTSKNDGKKYNLELNKSSINDRYSNASYDSVGHTTNIDYINEGEKYKDVHNNNVSAANADNTILISSHY